MFRCDQNGPPARRSEPDWRKEGAYINGYVTDEHRSRRPIFIPTLWAVASWLFFRVARSLRIDSRYARRNRQSGSDRPDKHPNDLRRNICLFRGQDTSTRTTLCFLCYLLFNFLSLFESLCGGELTLPYAFPFGLLGFEFGMRNKTVPDHSLKCLGMRGNVLGIHSRNNAACVSDFGGESAISANDPMDRRTNFFSVLQC